MHTSRLLVAFTLVTLSGCRCGPPTTGGLKPDFEPDPKALSFEACPTKDESGAPVKDVFPDSAKVTLKNLGKAGGLVEISFTGPGKDNFSLVTAETPTDLGPTSTVEFPVLFSPTQRGDTTAVMVIDDGNEETAVDEVALSGTGRNLPSQPTLVVALQNKDTQAFEDCFAGGTCLQVFPDTFYDETATLKINLKNTGCPALRITALELDQLAGGTGNLAFSLVEPMVPPTEATPVLLTTSDDRAQTTLSVRFAPQSDTTGITQRYALLKVRTNDPVTPAFDIQLFGNAAEPSVYSQPTFCDFSLASDLCGNTTKVANKAKFEIKNGGNTNIVIDTVTLSKGGQGRFAITANVQGRTIAAGASELLEVTHTDAPVYVTELLTVTATAGGQSAGSVVLSLAGGVQPCMTSEPLDQLDFQDPATELTKKTITVKNGVGCGDLVINRIFVDTNPFFSVVDPLVPAGTVVKANAAVIATVQYKKPVSGGTQTSVLRIDSNDPDFGPSAYKVIRLYSNSPLDQLPVADLKGCLGTDTTCMTPSSQSMNVRLSMLSVKELIMWGKDSSDPGNASPTAIKDYRFQLFKPTNAAGASLENDGVKTTKSTAKLTLDPAATGQYRVVLTVWDDHNQQSPSAAELKIFVAQ